MKITTESQKMTLTDHNYSHFGAGLLFLAMGLGIAFFLPNGTLLTMAFGGIFALAGLWSFFSAKMVTVVLDKVSGQCRVSLRSLLKNESRGVRLEEIKEVSLRKTIVSSGKSTQYQFNLVFALKSGDEIPLEFDTVSGGLADVLSGPDEKIRAKAKPIADFLGVPFTYSGTPSPGEVLSSIQKGIADGIARSQNKGPIQPPA